MYLVWTRLLSLSLSLSLFQLKSQSWRLVNHNSKWANHKEKNIKNEAITGKLVTDVKRRKIGALTIWMEFSVIPGRIQMERFIPVENFRKKGNTFRGISFPCFYRNSRKFLYHLSILTSARLLAVKLLRKKAKDLKDSGRFPKRLSSQCVSSLVGSVGGRLRTQLQPCRWKRIKFCGRYLCFSFTYVIRASSVLPHELHWGKTMWMPIADFPDVRWMLKQPNRWNCRLFSKKY